MQHYNSIKDLNLQNSWVTIGSFDGVHLGHQSIISPLAIQAHNANSLAVVVTFYPNPAVVLRGIKNPYYLTTQSEQNELLEKLGIDVVITLPFNQETASTSAETFIEEVQRHLGIKSLWVGVDFALGRGRQGSVEVLADYGQRLGFELKVIPPLIIDGAPVSSSRIRQMIGEGNVQAAALLLGRYFTVSGSIIHGDGRAHRLGFPTANIQAPVDRLSPKNGVYAVWAWVDGERKAGITNIGTRPTFEDHWVAPRIETHILDYYEDLYGQNMLLEFVDFIRPEVKFNSVEELKLQVQKDILRAKEVLQHAPKT